MGGFVDYLPEVFADFGRVGTRKMFGGWGVYHDGLMFGLVVDDTLFLKADAGNVHFFEQQGLGPFEYVTRERRVQMSYYRAPDDIFDDRGLAAAWARRSFDAALRAKAGKGPARRAARKKKR